MFAAAKKLDSSVPLAREHSQNAGSMTTSAGPTRLSSSNSSLRKSVLAALLASATATSAPCVTEGCVRTAGRMLSHMDTTTSPCDDAHQAFCGDWLKTTNLPSDMSSIDSSFTKISLQSRQEVRSILEGWTCPDPSQLTTADNKLGWQQLAGCMYSQCLDEEAADKMGGQPLISLLSQGNLSFLGAATDGKATPEQLSWSDSEASTALAERMALLHLSGVGSVAAFFSHQHPTEPSEGNILHVVHTGLGLSYDMYTARDPTSVRLRDRYKVHITTLLQLLAEEQGKDASQAEARAGKVFDLELRLRELSLSPTQARDAVKTTNEMSVQAFTDLAKSTFDVQAFIAALNKRGTFPDTAVAQAKLQPSSPIVVDNPDFFASLHMALFPPTLSKEEAYGVFNDFLLIKAIRRTLPVLGGAWKKEHTAYSQAVSGATQPPRWRECMSRTRSALSWIVGEAFVEGQEGAANRAQFAESVLDDVRGVFRDEVKGLGWIDDVTAERALEKETKIVASLGSPKWMHDHARFDKYITAFYGTSASAKAALEAAGAIESDSWVRGGLLLPLDVHLGGEGRRYGWSDLGKPADREVWYMTPDEVNAYYMPSTNDIVFPDSILRAPFLDAPLPADSPQERVAKLAVSYGAFGAVVGHELTHAFDDQGSTMDGDGRMVDWWTPQARRGFEAASECMAKQYSAFTIPELDGEAFVGAVKTRKVAKREPTIPTAAPAAAVQGRFRASSGPRHLHDHAHDHVHGEEGESNMREIYPDVLPTTAELRTSRDSLQAPPPAVSATPAAPTLTPEGVVTVNGHLTLGENIADAGGLRLALLALEKRIQNDPTLAPFLNAAPLPGLNYTPAQLAVASFGQIWCVKSTTATARSRAASDPHAPGSSRVVGSLMNLPGFDDLFKCEAGARVAGETVLPANEQRTQCNVW